MSDFGGFEYQRVVAGYHGCDRNTAMKVLRQEEHLEPSDNEYDWLGAGRYFWEFGPRRALKFAHSQEQRGKVEEPAVLGAYINLGQCLDLTDVEHTSQLKEAYELFCASRGAEQSIPENRPADDGDNDLLLRYLDCAVIDLYMKTMDDETEDDYYYQTVRGVFQEGEAAYPGAEIRTKSHIQIAVRDPNCILGYFLPTRFFNDGGDDEQGN